MGRKKLIEDEDLQKLVYEYYDYCGCDFSNFKFAKLGAFIRANHSPSITDTLLRRSSTVIECVDMLKNKAANDGLISVALYKTIDIDALILNNNSINSIKKTIIQLDDYYKQICDSYSKLQTENERLKKELNKLKKANEKLANKEHSLSEDNNILSNHNSQLESQIKYLKDYIENTVYPEIANELLKKDGLLHNTVGIISETVIEDVIKPTDNIKSESKIISNMFNEFI